MHGCRVHPFGPEIGFDFNGVEKALVCPGLKEVWISSGITGVFIEQGNIRTDMCSRLLIAEQSFHLALNKHNLPV